MKKVTLLSLILCIVLVVGCEKATTTYDIEMSFDGFRYEPIMSSVPGLPIEVVVDGADNEGLELIVHSDAGNLQLWTPEGRIVSFEKDYRGPFLNTALYWSPLADDVPQVNAYIAFYVAVMNTETEEITNRINGYIAIEDGTYYLVGPEDIDDRGILGQ